MNWWRGKPRIQRKYKKRIEGKKGRDTSVRWIKDMEGERQREKRNEGK